MIDVNTLFGRAEQSFAAGRLDAARADLLQVQRLAGAHPSVLHLLGLVEKRRGDLTAARAAFEQALRLTPKDPQLLNNHANLLDTLADHDAALAHYDRALAANPKFADARFNRALLLQRLGRSLEALAELDTVAAAGPPSAKLQSARGACLRNLGRLPEAASAYDDALRLEPSRLVALHGRARVAMEGGEPDASDHYKRAVSIKADDPELQLGLAEALEAEGKPGAVDALANAVDRRPDWIEGHSALARMRWEAGEGGAFTRGFEPALRAAPGDPDLWFAYASALAAANLHAEAADAAARGRSAAGDTPGLILLEAVHASEAGDLDRATKLFARLPSDAAGNASHRLRHLVRVGEVGEAERLTEAIRAVRPWDVQTWAMLGLIWRLMGDARHAWLHEQAGLVDTAELGLEPGQIVAIADRLRSLHRTRAHPIGQSLRSGTQTRGRLFERSEPEVVALRDAIMRVIAAYWNALPAADPAHPLLRHRASPFRLDGSWSVRLTDGGFHVAHVHPNGILSSACYLVVPNATAQEGWLEVGGPPANLDLPLAPLRLIEPRPGLLALFPSTLFHGTRPFTAGERLTAAFDVVVDERS